MKTWVKVVLGIGAVAAAGLGVAFLGKKHHDEAECEIIEEAETDDLDSDEEAE